jgi:uncharacterized protein
MVKSMKYILTSKQYMEGLKDGRFLGLKCNQCHSYTIPPMKVCSECGSEDIEVVELSRDGKVKTFTQIFVPAEGFQAPYIVALIELVEGPWVTVSMPDIKQEQVTMDLIGRKGKIDYKDVPADMFSGGERIALSFTLE